jgi:ABC-2 type transport system permease protein
MMSLLKLTWIEIKLFVREPITMVFTFALPLIFLFVMGGVFGNTPDPGIYRGVGAMNYYIPAYFALVMSSIGVVALPLHLTGYRERGVLRRFRASSFSVWSILGSQVIVSFVIAMLGGLMIVACGRLAYSLTFSIQFGWFILAFVISTLCFTAIGFFLGAVLPTTRAAQGLGLILFFVMMILGGAGPPPEVLTGVMGVVGNMTPIRHVIITLQDPWLGYGWNITASLIVSGIFLAATLLSVKFFKWE